MEKKTPYKRFDIKANKELQGLIKGYKAKMEKPDEKFKERVHFKYLNEIRKDHLAVQTDLGVYKHFYSETIEEAEDEGKNLDSWFNEKFIVITDTNKEVLLKNLAKLEALNRLFEYLQREGVKYQTIENSQVVTDVKVSPPKTSIHWKSNRELEFVQLIYALHEAGYLNNEEEEITKLVKQVAASFNYKLGDHWQSNLSDCINNRNIDYSPKIFENLQKAFSNYRERQIEFNKKKRPK